MSENPIKAIIWQPEGVWYKGMFTVNYLPNGERPADDVVRNLQQNEYLTWNDLTAYQKIGFSLRKVKDVTALIGLLMGGPYPHSWNNPDEVLEYRDQIRERMAGIGASVADGVMVEKVLQLAKDVDLTEGAEDVVSGLRASGFFQAVASNDLSPFVYGVANRLGGVDLVETETVKINRPNVNLLDPEPFNPKEDYKNGCVVSGRCRGGYNGVEDAVSALGDNGYSGSDIMIVGGVQPDIGTMQRVVEEGGLSLGFNPDVDTQRMLERRGMRSLIQHEPDLTPIGEIANDPGKLDYYCL